MRDPTTRELQEKVAARAARAEAAGDALRSASDDRLLRAIADTAQSLRGHDDAEVIRGMLAQTSGLSRPMVDWALEGALDVSEATLEGCLRTLEGAGGRWVPLRLAAMVLAGNVFTASFQPLALALLARTPLVVKASSRDDAFPRFFVAALRNIDEELSRAIELVTFQGGQSDLEDALVRQADSLIVFGSDRTVRDLRSRAGATTEIVAHGHGLGLAFIPRDEVDDVAPDLARDVAAYDQRGCLSPHAVLVEMGGRKTGRELAEALARELEKLRDELPRGALPMDIAGGQLQWRGVGAVRGELFEGDGYGVTFEGSGPFRVSPGYRNVSILEVEDLEGLGRRLRPLGVHLKALGVAGAPEKRSSVARAVPPSLAPKVSAVGAMQTPPFGGASDGLPAFSGLVRWMPIS